MDFGDYRHKVRRVAFYTIFGWIVLTTVVVVLMIWNAMEDIQLSNIIWTATAITVGVLLGCITYFGFASAEDESREFADTGPKDRDPNSDGHLREAFDKAKITPPES